MGEERWGRGGGWWWEASGRMEGRGGREGVRMVGGGVAVGQR